MEVAALLSLGPSMEQEHTSVASHLGIPLPEYDARIRTFVPFYDEMLDGAAAYFALSAGAERASWSWASARAR